MKRNRRDRLLLIDKQTRNGAYKGDISVDLKDFEKLDFLGLN